MDQQSKPDSQEESASRNTGLICPFASFKVHRYAFDYAEVGRFKNENGTLVY